MLEVLLIDHGLSSTVDPRRVDELVAQLRDHGFVVAGQFVPEPLVAELLAEAESHERRREMRQAGVGRGERRTIASGERRVESRWLEGASQAERRLLAIAEALRLAINRQLYLGLFDLEAQQLHYPPGGFYARHLDSLAGARNRIVSLVLYLDAGWGEADGGELLIWRAGEAADAVPAAIVRPEAGTLVLMLSEEIPHEVRPARRSRHAVAGWFRVNASTGGRVDPAG